MKPASHQKSDSFQDGIADIYVSDEPANIDRKLRLHREGMAGGTPQKNEILAQKARLRKEILSALDLPSGVDAPIILTGHQPIFYHPGILMKDLLAAALAERTGGTALNVVVDTDEALITFDYPRIAGDNVGTRYAVKKRLTLNRSGEILKKQTLNPEVSDEMILSLREYGNEVDEIFPTARAVEVRRHLDNLVEFVTGSTRVSDPGVHLREYWERENGIKIHTIYASDLIKTEAFAFFTDLIIDRDREFRQKYNHALEEYRQLHRIKNLAQPLPNLNEGRCEMPFWAVIDDRRIPLTGNLFSHKHETYPRAVTLTLFCRLFLCDIFVHGLGGARYEAITDKLLHSFFHSPGAPFLVATATMNITPRKDFKLNSRKPEEINRDIRAVRFDPTRFLDAGHDLRTEKEMVLARMREPGCDRREIHRLIMDINERTRLELDGIADRLQAEKNEARFADMNRAVFGDRTYPFIFYELRRLLDYADRFR